MPAPRFHYSAMYPPRSMALLARMTSETSLRGVPSRETKCECSPGPHHRHCDVFIEDVHGGDARLFHRHPFRSASTVLGGSNRLHRRSSAFGRDLIEVSLSSDRNPRRWWSEHRHGSKPGERADPAFWRDHCLGLGLHVRQSSRPHASKLCPAAGRIHGASCGIAVSHGSRRYIRYGRVADRGDQSWNYMRFDRQPCRLSCSCGYRSRQSDRRMDGKGAHAFRSDGSRSGWRSPEQDGTARPGRGSGGA